MVTQHSDGTVEFRFFRPHASAVMLVGEFNGWNQCSLPMSREEDGWWRARLRLGPGAYQFRYLGDGEWFTDYAASGLVWTKSGLNSLARVQTETTERPTVVTFPHISESRGMEPAEQVQRTSRTPAAFETAVA